MVASANFGFLESYDSRLVAVAALAEQYFPQDPITSLMKLWQFAELLAQQAAARFGVSGSAEDSQADLLARLRRDAGLTRDVIDLFHDLRNVGNRATHQQIGDHATALTAIKTARQLAIWFHRSFGGAGFKPGPFQPPRAPDDPTVALKAELAALKDAHQASLSAAEAARQTAQAAEDARRSAEERAAAEAKDRAFWEAYAADAEARQANVAATLAALQAAAPAAATIQLRHWSPPPIRPPRRSIWTNPRHAS